MRRSYEQVDYTTFRAACQARRLLFIRGSDRKKQIGADPLRAFGAL